MTLATGLLIQAVTELMKFETGLAGDIFLTPPLFEVLVMDTWIKRLWLDCIQYDVEIQTDLLNFQPPHSGYFEIMRLLHSMESKDKT